ncbi:hypothetical protein Barb7_02860 [Bacteroidales bacterium Barb7]|nr:hypothetical protein Barb7_02860 [Bacteroidales bacterium Barb7]
MRTKPIRTLLEIRRTRLYHQRPCRSIHPCCPKYIVRLPDGKGNALHIIQREAADVRLPALRIGNDNPVIAHRRMLRTQTAYRNRLQPADTAVVLDRHTRKAFHRL